MPTTRSAADTPESTPDTVVPVVAALQELIRIPTVSRRDPAQVDVAAFHRFVAALAELFPRLHRHLTLDRIGNHGLLMRWRGRTSSDPVVLMAHLDVVPVDEDAAWTHPPFGGVLADSPEGPAVWGRGSLDDKGQLVAICAAVERLLADGVTPARDVWLAFGSDEEVGGTVAQAMVEYLGALGVTPWFVLDEGGAVADDVFPGVSAPVGVVGVAEKGSALLELTARGDGGHSSTPQPGGPTARIAQAVLRLDRRPMAASLPAPTAELLTRLAPYAAAPMNLLLSVAGRIGPVTARMMSVASAEAAAMTRTTLATTTLSGSPAGNVIAARATAGVNARILPGDTLDDVTAHVRRAVDDDSISIDVVHHGEAGPVSPYRDDPAFTLIEDTIRREFPDAVPSPYVVMAATDSRHFTAICPRVYRFTPFRMSLAQRRAIHSHDERLTVSSLLQGVDWYSRLLMDIPS